MMEINSLTLLIIVFVSSFFSLIIYILFQRLEKKSKYNVEKDRVILEDIRNSIEQKMYALNDRMVQSEERWKDVNHLLLRSEYLDNSSSLNPKEIYYSEFLKANGLNQNDLNLNDRLVFVLTPFNEQYYNEFMIINEVCESMGLKCIRGDEKEFKGDIFPEMLKYIAQSRLVIANINGRNPNVMYELGVAQAMDKSVILLSREPKDLPIDIQSQRFLIYSDSKKLRGQLKEELQKII